MGKKSQIVKKNIFVSDTRLYKQDDEFFRITNNNN